MSVNLGVVVHGPGDVRVQARPDLAPGPGHAVVEIHFGGVCGSDVSYVKRGSVGESVIREPMVLGHEVSGVVVAIGGESDGSDGSRTGPQIGDRVTIHPATPDGTCPECLDGRANQCRSVRYLGSAAMLPHTQGGFVERLVVRTDHLVVLPPEVSLRRGALAEPLAVAVHAIRRAAVALGRASRTSDPGARVSARPLSDCSVLVTGAGPIGSLAVATAVAAGARAVAVTDLVPRALEVARKAGAGVTIDVSGQSPRQAAAAVNEAAGEPDVVIESSGSAAGLATAIYAVRRGGVVITVGLVPPGDVPVPMTLVATREITISGSFRFDDDIVEAVDLLAAGLPVGPIVSHELAMLDATAAIVVAADAATSTKVLLATPVVAPAARRQIVVTGLMGSGKTSVASLLATRLGRPLRDSDTDLEAVQGRSAAEIAATDGADVLHTLEAAHALDALRGEPCVVAAAGWIAEAQDARPALGEALVIYLDGDPAVLARRFAANPHRPVYGPPLEVLTAQHARRHHLFMAVADIVVAQGTITDEVDAALGALADHGIVVPSLAVVASSAESRSRHEGP